MNIFISFFQSAKKHPIPAYDFWQYYIKNGIAEAGHHWSECPDVDWAQGLVPASKPDLLKWKQNAWDKTVAWLKKHPSDIFLSYLYPHQVDINAIKEIKRLGIPCINFYCDHLRDFKKLPAEFSVFDLNWVPEYKAIRLYQKASYPHINLPMPIWVEPKLRVLQKEINDHVTFIGSNDIQRQSFFEKVVQSSLGINLAVYGNGWQQGDSRQDTAAIHDKIVNQFTFLSKHGLKAYYRKIDQKKHSSPLSGLLKSKTMGVPAFDQYNELISGSMITVGINRYPSFHFPFDQPDSYSRLRDIEAPMLGACYLTEWTEGIDDLYETGKDIETYKNETEFIEKVKELASDSSKRKTLKINGQQRALQAHSIPSTLIRLFDKLGIRFKTANGAH